MCQGSRSCSHTSLIASCIRVDRYIHNSGYSSITKASRRAFHQSLFSVYILMMQQNRKWNEHHGGVCLRQSRMIRSLATSSEEGAKEGAEEGIRNPRWTCIIQINIEMSVSRAAKLETSSTCYINFITQLLRSKLIGGQIWAEFSGSHRSYRRESSNIQTTSSSWLSSKSDVWMPRSDHRLIRPVTDPCMILILGLDTSSTHR